MEPAVQPGTDDSGSRKDRRVRFLDNLRTFLVFLVVVYHAGGVYESSGVWAAFWLVDDPATNNLVGILGLVIDIFVMPVMFFISGYFTPASLARREPREFLKRKLKRLMLPWLVAVLTLVPLYKVVFLGSRGLPQEPWSSYFHLSNGFISQSWLWFLPVLFSFDLLYVALRGWGRVPMRVPWKSAALAVFVVGFAFSLGADVLDVRGWTKTPLLDFQNERLPTYFMAFLLGSLSYHQDVFAAVPRKRLLPILVHSTAWIPVGVYVVFLLAPFFVPEGSLVSPLADAVILWLSFQLALFATAFVVIDTFWRYFDRAGTFWTVLNRNSYYVYVVHVVVLGGVAWMMLDVEAASLPKFFALTVGTYLGSNLLVSLQRTVARSSRGRRSAASVS